MSEWIKHTAIIQAIDSQEIRLQPIQGSGCASCQLAGACGQGALARWMGRKPTPLKLSRHQLGLHPMDFSMLKVGMKVEIGLLRHDLLHAISLQFISPVLISLILLGLSEWIGWQQHLGLQALTGALGLGLGFLWVHYHMPPINIHLLRVLYADDSESSI